MSTADPCYILQITLGDFRLVGPFLHDQAACEWQIDQYNKEFLRVVHFNLDQLHDQPKFDFHGSKRKTLLKYFTRMLEATIPRSQLTLPYLASIKHDLLPEALNFYILTSVIPDKDADDTITIHGPFDQPIDAKRWAREWLAKAHQAHEIMPICKLMVCYSSTLADPIKVIDPDYVMRYPLADIRLPPVEA